MKPVDHLAFLLARGRSLAALRRARQLNREARSLCEKAPLDAEARGIAADAEAQVNDCERHAALLVVAHDEMAVRDGLGMEAADGHARERFARVMDRARAAVLRRRGGGR